MQYIGNELQERMDLLGINIPTLAEMTFMDEDVLSDIVKNELAYEEIEDFDKALICGALHCDEFYFVDDEVRKRDLLISTFNRGNDSIKSKNAKAKIQDFMKDYAFVNEVLLEE